MDASPPLDLRAMTQLTYLSLSDESAVGLHVWFPTGVRILHMSGMSLAPECWPGLARTCRYLEHFHCRLISVPPVSPQLFVRPQGVEFMITCPGVASWAAELASRSQEVSLYLNTRAASWGHPAFRGLHLLRLSLQDCTADAWKGLSVSDLHVGGFAGTCITAELLPSSLASGNIWAMRACSMTIDLVGCAMLQSFTCSVKSTCRLQLNGKFQVEHEHDRQKVTWLGAQSKGHDS